MSMSLIRPDDAKACLKKVMSNLDTGGVVGNLVTSTVKIRCCRFISDCSIYLQG